MNGEIAGFSDGECEREVVNWGGSEFCGMRM